MPSGSPVSPADQVVGVLAARDRSVAAQRRFHSARSGSPARRVRMRASTRRLSAGRRRRCGAAGGCRRAWSPAGAAGQGGGGGRSIFDEQARDQQQSSAQRFTCRARGGAPERLLRAARAGATAPPRRRPRSAISSGGGGDRSWRAIASRTSCSISVARASRSPAASQPRRVRNTSMRRSGSFWLRQTSVTASSR